ncbi:MAG TPA: T9SS type A sorting domain-containing protein [Saprospiraceae bacterium]|nr:T9SS type A sorting domain-containing protein [Saprospiraceae bacterium]
MKYFFIISVLLFGSITAAFSQENGNCTVCCQLDVASYADCVDFEEYTEGPIVPQASPKFTLFSSSSQNATIKTFPAGTNNKCVYFENVNDIDYNIDRVLSEDIAARLEWKMYLINGNGGSWGIETNDPLAYPLGVLMGSDLVGTVFKIQNGGFINLANFNFQANTWIKFAIIFSPKQNSFELWVDGEFVYKVTDYMSNKVTDLNLYGDGMISSNGFYIDDICYRETDVDIACTLEYNPVCVNSKTYVNACFAYIDGYTDCEYIPGECTTSTIETSQTFPVFYPNPSRTGHFYTQDQNISYTTLINTNGQSHPIVAQQGDVDLSHLPCGVYILSGTKDSLPFKVKLVLVE